MKLTKCDKNHYYDADKYKSCPHCAKMEQNPPQFKDQAQPNNFGMQPNQQRVNNMPGAQQGRMNGAMNYPPNNAGNFGANQGKVPPFNNVPNQNMQNYGLQGGIPPYVNPAQQNSYPQPARQPMQPETAVHAETNKKTWRDIFKKNKIEQEQINPMQPTPLADRTPPNAGQASPWQNGFGNEQQNASYPEYPEPDQETVLILEEEDLSSSASAQDNNAPFDIQEEQSKAPASFTDGFSDSNEEQKSEDDIIDESVRIPENVFDTPTVVEEPEPEQKIEVKPAEPEPVPKPEQPISKMIKDVAISGSMEDAKTVAYYNFGDDAEPVVGWLVALNTDSKGCAFELNTGKNTIGRSGGIHEVDVDLSEDPKISRGTQAVLIYEPKKRKFLIQPSNGDTLIYLNDDLLMSFSEIKSYDIIDIGDTKLIFIALCCDKFTWDDYE